VVIEHTFITTLEPKKVFEQVHSLLHSAGFLIGPGSLDQRDTGKACMEMTRGHGRNADPRRCYQSVHVEFDRGRVTVAASIRPAQRGSFAISASSNGVEPKPTSAWGKPYADLMITLARTLEAVLVKSQLPAEATQPWFQLEDQIVGRAQTLRRKRWLVVAFIVGLLLFLIVLASANAGHGHVR
jgi:hypothetical protein